ncbi:hypothetical protein B7G54_15555 [Burkholderia puraquae]|uniref:DUF3022 domain-containing protein n=1 Tax=Burkholderia puraquae TaxID=1904757 RepID=A0A1X1PGX4_9BURK|nr:hypothetical protein [Burkholderia puraquae]ORT85469.1 hypothetical protein B7G54_15555 [Burkholderia puraquae]CAB3756637.1 hypothetical protein LMG29660_02913 [Burkholderia puraquae]
MQSHSRIWLENDEIDNEDADGETIDTDDLDTTVHVDVATGRVMFQAAWAQAADPPPETAEHSVVLVLDCDTMERYADLDEGTRMRVHAILHDTVQDLLDRLPDENVTLTVELTDAMLDAACRLQ